MEMDTVLLTIGPGFKKGIATDLPASLVDLAPTLAKLLGLSPLSDADGRVLLEALANEPAPGDPDPTETVVSTDTLMSDTISPLRVFDPRSPGSDQVVTDESDYRMSLTVYSVIQGNKEYKYPVEGWAERSALPDFEEPVLPAGPESDKAPTDHAPPSEAGGLSG